MNNLRKLVASLIIAFDGVVGSPGNWQFNYFNNNMIEGMKF